MEYTISVNDLLMIKEAATAIKQNSLAWYSGFVMGIIDTSYQVRTLLDINRIRTMPKRFLLFNARELNTFCKKLTTESEFTVDIPNMGNHDITLSTLIDNSVTLTIGVRINVDIKLRDSLRKTAEIDQFISREWVPEINITDHIKQLIDDAKSKGIGMVKLYLDQPYIQNQFIMVPINTLPVSKSDNVFMHVYLDQSNNTIITKFSIIRKTHELNIYMRFIPLHQ